MKAILSLVAAIAVLAAASRMEPLTQGVACAGGQTVKGSIETTEKLRTRGASSQLDVVLYLVAKEKVRVVPPKEPVVVDQAKLQFKPHVLPIVAGSTVLFQNSDRVKHNVFIEADCCKMDEDIDTDEKRSKKFAEVGHFPIVCRLHPEMSMHMIVLETNHFVAVKLKKVKRDGASSYQGEYAIEGVPPGDYVLKSWNKKLAQLELEITVPADKPLELPLVLSK